MAKIKYKKLIGRKKIDILTSHLAMTLVNEVVDYSGYWLYLNVLDGATTLYDTIYEKLSIVEPDLRKYLLKDSVKVSSYSGTENVGFTLEKDSEISLAKPSTKAIIIDDIIDSGSTLYNLIELLKTRGFDEFICVTLLDRVSTSKYHQDAIYYSAYMLEDEWVCGFGMDSLDGTYRDKKSIYQIINK